MGHDEYLIPFLLYSYISCSDVFNPLNAELNPICHLLALLGGATIVVVSRLRVKCTESNPILQTIHRTEMCGTALTANCGSGERYTVCRQTKRSE